MPVRDDDENTHALALSLDGHFAHGHSLEPCFFLY